MKVFFSTLLILTSYICASAQVVKVQMEKTEIHPKEMIDFEIICASEQDLELTVFTNGHLVLNEKSVLSPPAHAYHLPTDNCPEGKYFILITGNGFHVEKEFWVKK